MNDLVNTTQMYLKVMIELMEAAVPALRARIAERLGQAGPTVTRTVARMERDGLLAFRDESKELALTRTGYREGIRVMRKHRIAECFLDRIVGLDWELVHEEACRLEHVMSDRVTVHLAELLRHPASDPYGNPIPAWDQPHWDVRSRRPEVETLAQWLARQGGTGVARIVRIGESAQADPDTLRHFKRTGLLPGATGSFSMQGTIAQGTVVQWTVVHGTMAHGTMADGHPNVLEIPRSTAAQLYVRNPDRRHSVNERRLPPRQQRSARPS